MPRPSASVPPEAIRIEDEVWQEAFSRREPPRSRRLQAVEGRRSAPAALAGSTRSTRPTATPVRAHTPNPTSTPASLAAAPVRDELILPPPSSAWQDGPSANAVGGVPGRKTVTIRGYGAERNLSWPDSTRRRPARRAYERAGFKPDRIAMWAVMLGILLVIVAIASAHA